MVVILMNDTEFNYSDEAKLNRSIFRANDDDIFRLYVEDENGEYQYQIILEKIFPNVDVNKILISALGGKNNIINAYKEIGLETDSIPNIYLVDADFDLLLNEKKINDKHFIYLDRYNIESYFPNKENTIKYLRSVTKSLKKNVDDILNYDEWENLTYKRLEALHLLYAQFKCEHLNVKNNQYLDDNGIIKTDLILNQEIYLKEKYPDFEEQKQKIKKLYVKNLKSNPFKLINGKDLIKLLCSYINRKFNKTIRESDLREHLLNNIEPTLFQSLKDNINDILKQKINNKEN